MSHVPQDPNESGGRDGEESYPDNGLDRNGSMATNGYITGKQQPQQQQQQSSPPEPVTPTVIEHHDVSEVPDDREDGGRKPQQNTSSSATPIPTTTNPDSRVVDHADVKEMLGGLNGYGRNLAPISPPLPAVPPTTTTTTTTTTVDHEQVKEMLGGINGYGRSGLPSSSSSAPPPKNTKINTMTVEHEDVKEMLGGLNAYGRLPNTSALPKSAAAHNNSLTVDHEDVKKLLGGLNAYGRNPGKAGSGTVSTSNSNSAGVPHPDVKEMLGTLNGYGRITPAVSVASQKLTGSGSTSSGVVVQHQDVKEMIRGLHTNNNNYRPNQPPSRLPPTPSVLGPNDAKAMIQTMETDLRVASIPPGTHNNHTNNMTDNAIVNQELERMNAHAARAAGYHYEMDDLRAKKLLAVEVSHESLPGAHNHEGSMQRPARLTQNYHASSSHHQQHRSASHRDTGRPPNVSSLPYQAVADPNGTAELEMATVPKESETTTGLSVPTTAVDPTLPEPPKGSFWNRGSCNLGLVVVVIAATLLINVALSVGILCGLGNSCGGRSDGDLQDSSRAANLKRILSQEFGADYFHFENTPLLRLRTLDWLLLANNNNINDEGKTLAGWQLVQRFVLALFYLETSSAENPWLHCGYSENNTVQGGCVLASQKGGESRYGMSWMGSTTECAWAGIQCNAAGEVTRLRLFENNVHGNIPTELAKLKELTELDLSSNALSGPIPSNLGELCHLQILQLEENELNGWIPDSLASLTNLQRLAINNNTIIGSMPEGVCDLVESTGGGLGIVSDCLNFYGYMPPVICASSCCSVCCHDFVGCVDTATWDPSDFLGTDNQP